MDQYAQTIFNLVMTGLAIGSVAVIWRKLLNDLPHLREGIKKYIPYPASRALVCGFCFAYWLSLGSLIVFNPLNGWLPAVQPIIPAIIDPFIYIFTSWMILGFTALLWRSLFVIIQELIDYEMYTWNREFHPIGSERKR
ncbi:MAG: hypothetical protein WCF77_02625 [Minisyncoccia bacterium]